MTVSQREALEELARRAQQQGEYASIIKDIRSELFDKQLAVVDDEERNKACLCTRRAGKTSTWPRYAVIECLQKRGTIVRIWSQARLRAKELIWKELLDVCARHRLSVKSHETELRVTFENGSEVRLVGADKDKEAQKKRGDKTSLEIVLECQSFGPFLKSLVEEVVEPSLFDLRGTIVLEGTPGIVETGFWFYVTGDAEKSSAYRWNSKGMLVRLGSHEEGHILVGANWSCHRWSLMENPKLPNAKTAKADLEALKKKRGWQDNNPTYLREYKAQWATDKSSLYYKFDVRRNSYSLSDVQPWGKGWSHVLGWDIGFNDSMALVVWAWREYDDHIYEAFSWSANGNEGRVEVINKIHECDKRFNIVKRVADTGGGGRLHVAEIQAREGLVFEAAQKTEKYAHVTLMNDDFITGKIQCIEGSSYSQCVSALPKDPDWDPESGKPPAEDPRFPNHEADAGLYSWRCAQAYLAEEAPKPKPKPGTPEAAAALEQELIEQMQRETHGRAGDGEWWEVDKAAQRDDW